MNRLDPIIEMLWPERFDGTPFSPLVSGWDQRSWPASWWTSAAAASSFDASLLSDIALQTAPHTFFFYSC